MSPSSPCRALRRQPRGTLRWNWAARRRSTPLQVVQIFEQAGGRPFAVQHVSAEALQAQQEAATDPMAQSFSGLMRCVAQGDPIDMGATLKSFPFKLRTVREYAREALTA